MTNEPIQIFIAGHPRPQPRHRTVNGRTVAVVDANAKRWISLVAGGAASLVEQCGGREALAARIGIGAPLRVGLEFLFETKTESRHGNHHTQVPDCDNLAKLVLDVFSRANVWSDDCIVAELKISKMWSPIARQGVLVTVSPLAGTNVPGEQKIPDWL